MAIAAYVRKRDKREGIEAEATSMEDGKLVGEKRETRDDEEDVGRAGRAGRKRTRYIRFLQSKASI